MSQGAATAGGAGLRGRFREQGAIWYGLLGGPHWWAVHLGVSYLLVPHVCATGRGWLFWLVTAVTLAGTAAALAASVAVVRRSRGRPIERPEDETVADRDLGLGLAGIGISVLFLGVILMERVPVLFIDPCLQV